MIRVPAILLVAALTAAAPKADPLAGRIAVATTPCIDRSDAQSPQIRDDRTLLYERTSRRIWRNDLPDKCPGLDPDDVLIVETFGSQLCQGDRFRTLDRGSHIPGPYCRLGKFTAFEKPKH